MTNLWTEGEVKELRELRRAGHTSEQIGICLGRSNDAVKSKSRKLVRNKQIAPISGKGKSYYNTMRAPEIDLPIYTDTPTIIGDCIIVGDVQIPTTFWELAYMVDQVADLHLSKPRTLIIAGDFINADALSTYPHTVAPISLAEEFNIATDMLSAWSGTFDRIILLMGNHEMRIFKRLYGSIGVNEIRALFATGLEDVVEVYNVGQIIVKQNNINWRITHQSAYSKIKGRVANILAQKYQMNIISHHEHHLLQSRDDFDNYTIINNGGLHDYEKIAYVSQFDNTRTAMNNGFIMLRNGYPYMFTPYESWTNWNDWEIDAAELHNAMDQRIDRRFSR